MFVVFYLMFIQFVTWNTSKNIYWTSVYILLFYLLYSYCYIIYPYTFSLHCRLNIRGQMYTGLGMLWCGNIRLRGCTSWQVPHTHTHTHTHTRTYTHTHTHTYIHTHTYTYTCTHTYMQTSRVFLPCPEQAIHRRCVMYICICA